MISTLDRFPAAFFAAAATPASLTGLCCLLLFGPVGLAAGFLMALVIAGLHVVFLAVPIHALLSLRRTPGPVLVLAFSFAIGALPIPLLLGAEEPSTGFLVFGLLGMSGGLAFVLVSGPREEFEEAR